MWHRYGLLRPPTATNILHTHGVSRPCEDFVAAEAEVSLGPHSVAWNLWLVRVSVASQAREGLSGTRWEKLLGQYQGENSPNDFQAAVGFHEKELPVRVRGGSLPAGLISSDLHCSKPILRPLYFASTGFLLYQVPLQPLSILFGRSNLLAKPCLHILCHSGTLVLVVGP